MVLGFIQNYSSVFIQLKNDAEFELEIRTEKWKYNEILSKLRNCYGRKPKRKKSFLLIISHHYWLGRVLTING